MSRIKRYAEEVSVDMGLDGEITDAVLDEAQLRLDAAAKADEVMQVINKCVCETRTFLRN